MNNKGQWIIVVLMVLTGLGIFLYETRNTTANKKDTKYPISVSPILQERVETDKGKVLRVTYGQVVLEIPEKYNPSGLDDKTKSVYFFTFGKTLIPNFGEIKEGDHSARVLISPKNPLANYDNARRINNLAKNSYFLRRSQEYPTLMEYWNEEKQDSFYFTVDSESEYLKNFISCLPGFREGLAVKAKSILKMGDTSCSMYSVIDDTVVIKIRFDARLLPEGKVFYQRMDQLISSFIIKK